MATFPARHESAAIAITSLLPQVDRLYLYLNGYDEVPSFARDDRIVAIVGGRDLSANGKTVAFDYVSDGIILTVDDDFVYPPDYVGRLVEVLRRHHGHAVVCVHGSVFAPDARWYYERSTVYGAAKELDRCRIVTLAGSGTAAFDQSILRATSDYFCGEVAVDLRLSILARQRRIPVICVDRKADWLFPLRPDGGLWQEFVSRLTHHTPIMRKNGPWTFRSYARLVQRWFKSVHGPLDRAKWVSLGLDEQFFDAVMNKDIHPEWRVTRLARRQRSKYRALLAAERNRSPFWRMVRHPRRTVVGMFASIAPEASGG